MSRVLVLSFDAPASPGLERRSPKGAAARRPDHGWGIAWFPPDELAAVVVKDPASSGDDAMARMLRDWSRFRSTVFIGYLRGAASRVAQEDTHPFVHSYGGRSWVLTHIGYLEHDFAQRLPLGENSPFTPIGRTDTEHVLCWLLGRLREAGCERLADVGWERLDGWLREVDSHGQASLILSDGLDVVVHQDEELHEPLYWTRRRPPHAVSVLANDELEVDLSDARDTTRTAVIVGTAPLSSEGWSRLEPSQTLVIRRGAVTWDSRGEATAVAPLQVAPAPVEPAPFQSVSPPIQAHVGEGPLPAQDGAPAPASPAEAASAEPAGRTYRIHHSTHYAYESPIDRSTHILRVRPVEDRHQKLLSHRLELTPQGVTSTYEDVFGNQADGFDLGEPYQELSMTASSTVRVLADARDLHSPSRRSSIPLVWMPWQRQMMMPYLLPHELPETQLRELFDYTMSFVERQDYDLAETLLDINRTIFRDYAYVQGSTTVETTPFDVYTTRRGVCQDFANLLICMARLIGVPARYRVGYIHTGADYENKLQSDASHAWAELYLPWFGWQGFDPTNGCLAALDHVRVACGRNYRDATPTSGTIFRGGGTETLTVAVRVELVEP